MFRVDGFYPFTDDFLDVRVFFPVFCFKQKVFFYRNAFSAENFSKFAGALFK